MGTSDQATVSAARTVKRPRQMRTNEEKRRIVEETLVPGISLASVAFKHGVNANLLFSWRRLHRRGLLERSREPASLMPVTITPAVVDVPGHPGSTGSRGTRRATTQSQAGSVAIELPSGIVLRVQGSVDSAMLEAVLSALRAG
jgi:transposase